MVNCQYKVFVNLLTLYLLSGNDGYSILCSELTLDTLTSDPCFGAGFLYAPTHVTAYDKCHMAYPPSRTYGFGGVRGVAISHYIHVQNKHVSVNSGFDGEQPLNPIIYIMGGKRLINKCQCEYCGCGGGGTNWTQG